VILDLDAFAQQPHDEFDLCIVGGGAAGITLAREFAGRRARVCLLESGGLKLAGEQALCAGETQGLPYPALVGARLRYLGGATNHWGGQSHPFEPDDFDRREWVPGSGWPIAHSEFARYLPRAHAVALVPPGSYDWEFLRRQAGFPPLPFDPQRYGDVVFRYARPATRFGEVYQPPLRDAGNIVCVLRSTALRLVASENGSHVTHAEVASLSGQHVRVAARRFVVACGGIENSRLLLLSAGPGSRGLGNDLDQVGRYFMDHPRFEYRKVLLAKNARNALLAEGRRSIGNNAFRIDFRLQPHVQREARILNHSLLIEPEPPPDNRFRAGVESLQALWADLTDPEDASLPYDGVDYQLRVRLECAPRAENRVSLGSVRDAFGQPQVRLRLTLGEAERRTLAFVEQQLVSELGRSHLGRVHVDPAEASREWPGLRWQYHHMGGTRMSLSPRDGVVDAGCRVHGIDNLYVAGSSVFPTSGHAHPTLNLIALTLRLADALKRELPA